LYHLKCRPVETFLYSWIQLVDNKWQIYKGLLGIQSWTFQVLSIDNLNWYFSELLHNLSDKAYAEMSIHQNIYVFLEHRRSQI
jgi:hypothetical protein